MFGANYPTARSLRTLVLVDASEGADADADPDADPDPDPEDRDAEIEPTGDPVRGDPRRARERLRRRGEAVRRRELDEALCTLDARGELTDDQRRAVRALAEGIVDGVLGPPRAALEGDAPVDERRAARTVTRLFDVEE